MDSKIKLWDIKTGAEVSADFSDPSNPYMKNSPHLGQMPKNICFTKDGKFVYSVAMDVRCWEIPSGKHVKTTPLNIYTTREIYVLADNKRFIHSDVSIPPVLSLKNLSDGSNIWSKKCGEPPASFGKVIVFPDEKSVLTSFHMGKIVKIYDVEDGSEKKAFNLPESYVDSLQLTPDNRIIVGNGNGDSYIFDINGNVLKKFAKTGSSAPGVALSPDGKKLIVASSLHTMKIFDAESTNELKELKSDFNQVAHISITSDLKFILVVQANIFNSTLRIYDYNTYDLVTAIPDAGLYIIDSTSNKLAVFTNSDHSLKLYDIVKNH